MTLKSLFLVFALLIIRKLQVGDIPLEVAAVNKIQDVCVILFMVLRVSLCDLTLADAWYALEENLIVFYQRRMEHIELRVASAKSTAGLRGCCVENVILHRR